MEDRRKNITTGIGLILLGLVFAVGAVFAAMRIAPVSEKIDLQFYVDNCRMQATRFGLSVTEFDGTLIIRGQEGGGSPAVYIDRVSALLGFCPAHRLETMCAGAECDEDVRFTAVLSLLTRESGS